MRKTVVSAVLAMFTAAVIATAQDAAKPAAGCAAGCKGCATPHVLAIKDGNAFCCSCSSGCKCTLKDCQTKCSCDKDVIKCNIAGKFTCGKCLKISDKAAKCCGDADMAEVKAAK